MTGSGTRVRQLAAARRPLDRLAQHPPGHARARTPADDLLDALRTTT